MIELMALPAPDEVLRCSDYTRGLAVDPGGSGIRADLLVAVEIPLPWPKPALNHELLAIVKSLVSEAPQLTKVVAAVPESIDFLTVVSYRRPLVPGQLPARTEWRTDLAGLDQAVAAAVNGDGSADHMQVDCDQSSSEIWLCTQGSHDVCCGSAGMRLAQAAASVWDSVKIRRVSHLGGHRFAPTGITFPSGRMWAYADIDVLDAELSGSAPPRAVAQHCRGWWGAEMGVEQMAERAAFAEMSWAANPSTRRFELLSEIDGVSTMRVEVVHADLTTERFDVEVRVSREVPIVSCRVPGGLPAKPSLEYEVVSLRRL